MNCKSNFVQFTNRIAPSLKFINRDSRSKVKSGIYKSQIRESVIYKSQMLYVNHKSAITKLQIRKLVCGPAHIISAQWYLKTKKNCTFQVWRKFQATAPSISKLNGGDRITCTTAFHGCLPCNQ